MTDLQNQLIEKLAKKNITATFNGDFLNCKRSLKSGKKTKWQKFSFVFDDAEGTYGSRLIRHGMKGAFCEMFAEQAAEIIAEHGKAARNESKAMTIETIKEFTRSQSTELLIATLTQIEESAEVKEARDGFKYKAFSEDEKVSRAIIQDIIEERKGEEFIEELCERFAV